MKGSALILGARGATALVAPVWALMLAVIVIPSIYVLWLSFHSSTFGTAPIFVGVKNYTDVLSDRYFWRAFANTLPAQESETL